MGNAVLNFFDNLYLNIIYPLVIILDNLLKMIFSPFLNQSTFLMIFSVSAAAAFISIILSFFFRDKNEKELNNKFKEKISSLKYLDEIEDKKIKKELKKNINDNADKIYENILIDKFFNFGITYLFPMFLFLIWLEYSVYPMESQKKFQFIFFTANISFGFLLLYNLNLVLIYIFKKILKKKTIN
jgi:hypothetical protein